MGRAYKCDLCKNCFPLTSGKTGQAYHGYFEDFMKDRSPEYVFDLCPECYTKLLMELMKEKGA